MQIIDGKKLSKKIIGGLKEQVSQMEQKPVLAIVSIGDDQASKIYIKNKRKACAEADIIVAEYCFKDSASEQEIIDCINILNTDANTTAIIVQLPVPEQIGRYKIFEAIDPAKDADCLNPLNFGSFFQKGEADFPIGPATPVGIIRLLEEYNISLEKKHAVLVGYSDIVGKPLSEMLLARNATATICHSRTENLGKFTREADILVSATGVRHLIKKDMVKQGAVVVDVGISREENKIAGDVDFENVAPVSAFITPVPGGVGPMTVAILLENVVRLADFRVLNAKQINFAESDSEADGKIEHEFQGYISKLSAQYENIAILKQNISALDNKLSFIENEKKKILRDIENSAREIIALKIEGLSLSMENYIRKIDGIIAKRRKEVEKILSKSEKMPFSRIKPDIANIEKLSGFEIPEKYDDYYESSKNYFENEISANIGEIYTLERKERKLAGNIEKEKSNLNGIIRLLIEWESWMKDRELPGDLYESPEEFELAVDNHFEHEISKLRTLA